MGKGIRYHAALGLALQAIIANGVGGVQRLLQVPRLQPVQPLLGVVGPDPGIAVGLQFQAYRQPGGTLGGNTTAARRFHLADWDGNISRKLNALESIYQKIEGRVDSMRMQLMELIIVLLILFEIVLPWVRR